MNKINRGDVVVVRKGETVPVDGSLQSSAATIDESRFTGESVPVVKVLNQEIFAGTVNLGEVFFLKVKHFGKETLMHNIFLKSQAIKEVKPHLQRLSDRISQFFFPIILACATGVFTVSYYLSGDLNIAFLNSLKVLVVACPCALGLVVPLVSSVGINKGLKNGIFFNKADAFDKLSYINTVLFDKTGTITDGHYLKAFFGKKNYLPVAYALQQRSLHPYAVAFFRSSLFGGFRQQNVELKNVSEKIGFGFEATYFEDKVWLTTFEKLKENKLLLEKDENYYQAQQWYQKGIKTGDKVIVVVIGKRVRLGFLVSIRIRKETSFLLQKLRAQKLKVAVVSGDSQVECQRVSQQFGIKLFFANVKPLEKAKIVSRFQKKYHQKVAFVGDGVNDTPALLQSDLGIYTGERKQGEKGGASQNSDIILLNNDLLSIYKAFSLIKVTNFMIKFNL